MPQPRNHGIELLRFVGAGAVVWFHLHLPGSWAAFAALHLFVILAVYFGAGRPLERHLRRLMLPWLFWSLVYGAAKLAQAQVMGTSLADEFAPWMVLTGLSVHLWFLPFTFVVVALNTRLHPLPVWAPPLLMGVALVVMRLGPYPTPVAQWVHVLPAAVLGLWMATRAGPLIPLAVTATLAAALWVAGFGKGIEQTAIAAALCLIVFLVPLRSNPVTSALASLSFGVYLVHPLVVALLMAVGIGGPGVLFVATLGLSVLLSAAMKRVLPFSV